jgi:hypothetical protein
MASKSTIEVFTRKGVDEKVATLLVENDYTYTKVARANEKTLRKIEKILGEKKLKQVLNAIKTKERAPKKKAEKPLKTPKIAKKDLPIKIGPLNATEKKMMKMLEKSGKMLPDDDEDVPLRWCRGDERHTRPAATHRDSRREAGPEHADNGDTSS